MDWRRIPSLASLRAFEAAARHQSFVKAASELNVTQAAIAQHVRKLEQDLSEPLVVRQGRGIRVTEIGSTLADSLNDAFAKIGRSIDDIRDRTESRPLVISTTPAFAANWLMPKLKTFWERNPEIELTIEPDVELLDLQRNRIDLAIRFGAGDWPGVHAELLTGGEFWVVASSGLNINPETSCVADVVDQTWLFEDSMLERKAMVESEGVDFARVRTTLLKTNSLVLAAVGSGLGVSIQAKSLVEDDVANGKLIKICKLSQDNLGYYLVYNKDAVNPQLRTLVKWLRSL